MQNYFTYQKKLQDSIISYIDNDDSTNEEKYFSDIIDIVENNPYGKEIHSLLCIISEISKYHQRLTGFFTKIEKILSFYAEFIKKTITNQELGLIFRRSIRLLFSLLNLKIIKDDEPYIDTNLLYFYPELETEFEEENITDLDDFEEKRRIGENPLYICELIRNDSVEEFIIYVNRNNISLSSTIKTSIFETNKFILDREPVSLIEYSAFFGSIQIFRYLCLNKVELNPNLWLFAIHGRNAEIIHLLEEYEVKPNSIKCYIECVKCFHNEIAHYIRNNLMDNKEYLKYIECFDDNNIISYCFRYHNYDLIPNDCIPQIILICTIKYDNMKLFKYFITTENINLNKKIISFNNFFLCSLI